MFYISLNPKSFNNFDFSWFGSVLDCKISNSRKLICHFQQFSDSGNPNLVHVNDEHEENVDEDEVPFIEGSCDVENDDIDYDDGGEESG